MMNYEMFKEMVKDQFLNHMPDDFANYRVEISQGIKVNHTVDSLFLIPPEGKEATVIPSLCVNRMYEEYQRSGSLQDTFALNAFNLAGAYRDAPDSSIVNNLMNDSRDKIVMMVVNTEQNRQLLQGVPHREFQDLSIIYRVVAAMEQNTVHSAIIKNGLMEAMGLNEEQLFKAAVENTKRMFPPVVKSMNDVIREMLVKDGMPGDTVDKMIGEIPPDKMMYVITNDRGINGAVSMLYEENLHKLADKLETDLYILPSSVHEVIAVSTDMGDPYELAQMVSEINMDQVDLDERLSNQVYYYDKDLRKLTLATDTPNKRLDGIVGTDGMVAEAPMIYEAKQFR